MNRKEFLLKGAALVGLATVPGLVTSCGGGSKELAADACQDLSEVAEVEVKKREGMGYVNQTTEPDKNCKNCKFYRIPNPGKDCGGCQLFKGPVHPNGYCNSWFAKEG